MTTDAADGGLTGSQRREVAYAAARRYLSSLTAEENADLPADRLRERLRECRDLLAAMVETSRPQQTLARTVDETAAALRISPLAVYRLINSGDLPAYRICRRFIRVDEEALRSYLAGHVVRVGGITSDDVPERHVQPAWR